MSFIFNPMAFRLDALARRNALVQTLQTLARSFVFRTYVLPCLLLTLGLGLRLAIAPVNAGLQYLTFFPVVTLAAIWGGYRAGLLATGLGVVLVTHLFVPPYLSWTWGVWYTALWSNLVFASDGVVIALAIEGLHRYRRKFLVALAQSEQARLALTEMVQRTKQVNERLVLATRAGGVGIWDWDLVRNQISWDHQMYGLYGVERDQFDGTYNGWLAQLLPADVPHVHAKFQRALKGECDFDVEFRTVWPDGNVHMIRALATLSVDEEGHALRLIGTNWDITQQKQSEYELRIAAATFNSRDAIMIVDARERILRVNPAFEGITGFPADEVIGQTPRILKSGRHDAAFYQAMWRQIHALGYWEGEVWDRRKGGEMYPKWLTITSVKNDVGETEHYVAVFSDITERKQSEDRIHNLAFYDVLTNLPNRRLLMDRLRLLQAGGKRHQSQGALLFVDLDNFKGLNDTKGHEMGDSLLQQVAQRLLSCVRTTDTVARLGGDEFVVILNDLMLETKDAVTQVTGICGTILEVLGRTYHLPGFDYHCSASIGAALNNCNAVSGDDLMKQADIAMYQAKSEGKNRMRFFDPKMQDIINQRVNIERELQVAIANQEFELFYQVQLDQDSLPLGTEALLRWRHPERGYISPAQFIPIAEASGLIQEIGAWVIDHACQQLVAWQASDVTRNLVLAVNISAHQFSTPDFVNGVKQSIRRYGVNPALLKLELTESVIVDDLEDVIAKMHALKVLGVRLALDDFGTGYSSLSYLKRLPLDQLKIDQSFVRDIVTDPSDAVMVKTIIEMAVNFGLSVIAEGVETQQQVDFLLRNGCAAYQGYFYGRPMPLQAFEQSLQDLPSPRVTA